MRNVVLGAALALVSQVSLAASIDPSTVEFPWKNGPTRDARYKMAEHKNTVHVFEAWSINCSWCNRNAPQVKAMAAEYAPDARVQFIDLGLDTNDRDYQRWIQSHAPGYPVVQDAGRAVWNALMQQNGIPQTFVVDCTGKLEGFTIGYWGAEEKEALRDAIARAKDVTCE